MKVTQLVVAAYLASGLAAAGKALADNSKKFYKYSNLGQTLSILLQTQNMMVTRLLRLGNLRTSSLSQPGT